ncbi:MAG: hypothetical protein R3C08_06650 [Hyphomonas sp.]
MAGTANGCEASGRELQWGSDARRAANSMTDLSACVIQMRATVIVRTCSRNSNDFPVRAAGV